MTTAPVPPGLAKADADLPLVLRDLLVQPVPEAIGVVRAFVRDSCALWGLADSAEEAVLIASELATNAVRYARTPVVVWLGRRPDRLVLTVEDASPERTTVRQPDALDEGGRGLKVVDALADRWGERDGRNGKLVWAEIATPHPSALPADGTGASGESHRQKQVMGGWSCSVAPSHMEES